MIADANFTATSLGSGRPVIALPGAGVQRTCAAVLSLLPLDAMVDQPVAYMKVCDTPEGYRSALQREVIDGLAAAGTVVAAQCQPMDRFAFYDRVKTAFAIVHTGELQPYANFVLKKGVLGEALRA